MPMVALILMPVGNKAKAKMKQDVKVEWGFGEMGKLVGGGSEMVEGCV